MGSPRSWPPREPLPSPSWPASPPPRWLPSPAIWAPSLTVVVLVHNEEESLPELHSRLVDSVGAGDGRLEIVYVDDGSTDRSGELIHGWMDDRRGGLVPVRPSRNFGMDVALSAGGPPSPPAPRG